MSLLSPAFLWGFALLAPLVAVYLLRVRPRRHTVNAIFLWDEIFSQRKATSLLQRLRDLFSLLLLALAALALVLAAARPQLSATDDRDILLLIDRSASMSADADPARPGHSRFAAAIDRAESLVRGLGGERRLAIATVDDRLNFATFLTTEPRRLRAALGKLTPGQGPSADAALDDIRQTAGLSDDLRVVLLTDGVGLSAPPGAPTADEGDADDAETAPRIGIEIVRIGVPITPGNLGLTAADLVATGDQSLTLFFAVTSSFPEPVDAEAILTDDADVVVKVIPLTLQPGANAPQVYGVSAGPGRYRLALTRTGDTPTDALPLDNLAYLTVPAPQPLRVAVDAADRYFFETAINAFAQSSGNLILVPSDQPSRQPADLTLARGAAPSTDNTPPLRVVFAPDATGDAVTAVGQPLQDVLPRVLIPEHPVLRFIPAESLAFAGAVQATPAPGSAVLVADLNGAPLIWQHRNPDTGAVSLVVNFDPAAADFVLSPYFPVLVHAAATHLGGRTDLPRSTFATGDRATIPGLRPGDTATVRLPRDDEEDEEDEGPRPAADAEGNPGEITGQITGQITAGANDRIRLDRAGFVGVTTPTGSRDLAASVLHPAESRLTPALFADANEPLPAVTLPGGYAPWIWLTLGALIVIVAEEVLYHRRKVG